MTAPRQDRPVRYTADWVLPVSAPPIAGGAVLIVDGRIAAVGPRDAVPLPDNALDVSLGAAIMLPGLVNVHAHPELSVLRGALEDLPFHEWIFRLRRIKANIHFTTEDWRDAARWTCAEAAAAGITTLGTTEDSDAALHALRDAGMRGVVYREIFGPDPAGTEESMRGLRQNITEMRRLETDLVRVGVSPHAPYTVTDALFGEVARFADAESLPVAVHAAESNAEQQLVMTGDGFFAESLRARAIDVAARGSTVELLERAGILALQPLLIHCVHVSDADMQRIAHNGARVAHCPVANARLGHGIAPVAEMLERGITIGLGSDSVASNNRIDMLEEARIAQMMQRVRSMSPVTMGADALLRLATIDGARALGVDRHTGTLEVGKDADLCVVRIDTAHVRPVFDPVAALFMSARGSDVIMTMVRGRAIYRDGAHLTHDMRLLRMRVDALGARVRTAARPTTV